jgi:hypothetical protein
MGQSSKAAKDLHYSQGHVTLQVIFFFVIKSRPDTVLVYSPESRGSQRKRDFVFIYSFVDPRSGVFLFCLPTST